MNELKTKNSDYISSQNYIVEVKCLEIDWIINEEQGRQFLNRILTTDS